MRKTESHTILYSFSVLLFMGRILTPRIEAQTFVKCLYYYYYYYYYFILFYFILFFFPWLSLNQL